MVKKISFVFFKTKEKAIKAGKRLRKPVFFTGDGYFVGNIPQAIFRLNLKNLVTGKIKRIK